MKAAMLPACVSLFVSICAFGFVPADFSGNWTLDRGRSDEMSASVNGSVEQVTVDLAVKQIDEGLSVESTWSNKPVARASYILDGNEHVLVEENGNSFAYRAKLNGDQLVIEGIRTVKTPFGDVKRPSKEEWLLSADKSTLTVTTTAIMDPSWLNSIPASQRSSYPSLFDSDGKPKPDSHRTRKQIYTRQ